MNYIRSNIENNNVRIGNSKENYGKLIVTLNETDYVVGEFHDTTEMLKIKGKKLRSKDIWYSFDSERNNFHIVPDYEVVKEYDLLTNPFKIIKDDLTEKSFKGAGKGSEVYTKGHFFNYYEGVEYDYLISLNRLYCTDNNFIHNNFGMIQFMRFKMTNKKGIRQINYDINKKFKMMYPSSGDDFDKNIDAETGHIVCNPPLSIKEPNKFNTKEIAKYFNEFINAELNNENDLANLIDSWKES